MEEGETPWFVGGLTRNVDNKKRVMFPAEWEGRYKKLLLWIPEKEKLIKELQSSQQKILGILAPSEEILLKIYDGDNYFDDIYSHLYEVNKGPRRRITLPKQITNQMSKNKITFIGCVEYIALVQDSVSSLLRR